MSKKKKKLIKQLRDVSAQNISICDSADSVRSFLAVARFCITMKDTGVKLGLLSDNDCVTLDDLVCDIIDDCCTMLSYDD